MIVELLTKHHLEFLSLKGGCTGSSESTTLLEISCHSSFLFFRETDLELHLSEKGNKKVEEDMGYIMLQVKLVPKTQEEKEQVSTPQRTQDIVINIKLRPLTASST